MKVVPIVTVMERATDSSLDSGLEHVYEDEIQQMLQQQVSTEDEVADDNEGPEHLSEETDQLSNTNTQEDSGGTGRAA